ncbi:MAG: tetratricopeptide repeat protein [Nitrospirae bacterium]|nr:tetratricopeptide repeat protein [Nitrospirota bacterium]
MKKSGSASAILAALITAAVYLPSLKNGFVNWDDPKYVLENLHIRTLDLAFFRWAFTDFYSSNWHPLTWISHAIDYAIWGLDPFGHHLTSVVLHGLNTFLVVIVVIQLIGMRKKALDAFPGQPAVRYPHGFILSAAFITGMLFGVHPLHVESVAWISERKDVLYAFFYLLSMIFYIRYAGKSGLRSCESLSRPFYRDRYYLASLVAFMFSLMSKQMAVTLPAALLIIDWYPLRRFAAREKRSALFIEKLPFLALSILTAGITFLAHKASVSVRSWEDFPLLARGLVAAKSSVVYIVKILVPEGLIAYYPYPRTITIYSPEFFVPLAAVICMSLLCISLRRRHSEWLALWGFYLVSLSPVLGIVQTGSQAMADRYTYLPALGPFLFFGIGSAFILEKMSAAGSRRLLLMACATALTLPVFLFFSYRTAQQIRVWKDSISLWTHAIESGPVNNPVAYHSRGAFHAISGRTNDALRDLDQAVRLSPRFMEPYMTRGSLYIKSGIPEKAVQDYTQAISIDNNSSKAYHGRGTAFISLGRYEEALKDFDAAISLASGSFSFYNDRAILLSRLNRYEEALRDYGEAVRLGKDSPGPFFNRGNLYARLGRLEEALKDYTLAVSISPRPVRDYHHNRAVVYERLGQHEKAKEDFRIAKGLN